MKVEMLKVVDLRMLNKQQTKWRTGREQEDTAVASRQAQAQLEGKG